MSIHNNKHTEWILETIDHLRKRKARPDMERICHVVRRRHGLSANDTEAKLEKLVDAEIVIKVDYKGSTSYRNAAKWRKSLLGSAVLNSTSISTKILIAIISIAKGTLIKDEPKDDQLESTKPTTSSYKLMPPDIDVSVDTPEEKRVVMKVGASLEAITSWLQKHCRNTGCDLLKSLPSVVIKREMDAGRIQKLDTGNYIISPEQMLLIHGNIIRPLKIIKKAEPKTEDGQPQPKATPINFNFPGGTTWIGDNNEASLTEKGQSNLQPARRGRPPKNRPLTATPPLARAPSPAQSSAILAASSPKILTEVLSSQSSSGVKKRNINHASQSEVGDDQSDKKVQKKSHASLEPVCDFCQLSILSNPTGLPEMLLCCKDCTARAHPSCMKYSTMLAVRASRGPWQCMDCKTCFLCEDPGRPDQMLFCDGCDRGYHMRCHQPSISKKPSGKWECSECKLENAATQRSKFLAQQGSCLNIDTDSAPPTPAQSPPIPRMSVGNYNFSSLSQLCYNPEPDATVYPDASSWSVGDVVDYLASAGFLDEASTFKEQEIDGVAVLLMKRDDVLRGLGLRLGPALKINRLVQGLQAARPSD